MQHTEKMQKIFSDRLIGTHRQREVSLRPANSSSSLNNSVTDCIQFFKFPGRRTFGQSSWRRGLRQHLNFTRQVMGHHGTDGKNLIGDKPSAGNYVKAGIVFGVTENGFLRSAAIVKQNNAFG